MEIKHTDRMNVLYEWWRLKFLPKLIFNDLMIWVSMYMPPRIKPKLLRLTGMKIGRNVGIAPKTWFDPFFPELIEIGDNTIIGMNVKILCHEMTSRYIREDGVKIGSDCLIGAFTVIREGVNIGDKATVAMCSFVNKNVPENRVYGGIPAKKIK